MTIIGTGIDIIEIDRIAQSIERWGDSFLQHVFVEEEIAYAQRHKNAAQHFAARFAAKEAVYKALNDRTLGWKDIKILNGKNGQPYCQLQANQKHPINIYISLSHSKNHAIANAIITNEPERL